MNAQKIFDQFHLEEKITEQHAKDILEILEKEIKNQIDAAMAQMANEITAVVTQTIMKYASDKSFGRPINF